jgi:hypothetical protein
MMSEAERLREQADLCYRLIRTTLDEQMAKALREYAADVEKKAATLEAALCCREVFGASPITTVGY